MTTPLLVGYVSAAGGSLVITYLDVVATVPYVYLVWNRRYSFDRDRLTVRDAASVRPAGGRKCIPAAVGALPDSVTAADTAADRGAGGPIGTFRRFFDSNATTGAAARDVRVQPRGPDNDRVPPRRSSSHSAPADWSGGS